MWQAWLSRGGIIQIFPFTVPTEAAHSGTFTIRFPATLSDCRQDPTSIGGNVFLSGSFQYEYQSRKDQQWLGLQDPYKTPFMLADSVAGAYALETYRMHAAVAVPVSKKLTLGGSLSYNARSGAKHRDLRNSDLYMDFEISPSLVYQSGPARIGAHLYFRRITEQVDFTQVETSTNKILFSFSGLWFNTRQVFTTSAPRTRLLKDHLYGGGLTAQYTVGKFSLYDHFSAGFRDQSQREDVVLAKNSEMSGVVVGKHAFYITGNVTGLWRASALGLQDTCPCSWELNETSRLQNGYNMVRSLPLYRNLRYGSQLLVQGPA